LGTVVMGKAVNLLGIVILSRLLDDSDYGYIGLAFAVYTFAALIQQGGLHDVLIQRSRHFERWASTAFWMSLALGLLATALQALAAPIAAYFFHDQRLVGLILALSTQSLVASLCVVPDARLRAQMRFRMLSLIAFGGAVGVTVLTILFAWWGFGPYSFVWPWPIMIAARAAALWYVAPQRVRPRMELRRWRFMFVDNWLLFLASVFQMVTWQGDYIILGRRYSKAAVGHYYWAFNLSTQALQMLSLNVAGVLLPSLAQLQAQPRRLRDAFLRAINMLTLIGAPACLLQAALADPVIRIAFEPRWWPAIPLVQILSAGWAFSIVGLSAGSLLKAEGRFRTYLMLTATSAALFVAMVWIGAAAGGVVGAAWAVAGHALVTGPFSIYTAIRPHQGGWRDTWAVYALPLAASSVTVGGAALLANRLPPMYARDVVRACLILALGITGYAALIRVAAPAAWDELIARAAQLLRRRRSGGSTTAAA
jgi:PST family polysaccharide transporter